MTAREEQETTIAIGRVDGVVRIWTNDLRIVRALRKLVTSRDYVTQVAGDDEWGDFRIPSEYFFLLSAIRAKRTLSAKTRAQRSAVLASARAARAEATS